MALVTLKAKKVGGGRGNKGQENPEFEYQGIDLKAIPHDVLKEISESLTASQVPEDEQKNLIREFAAVGFNRYQRAIASDPFYLFFAKNPMDEDIEKTARALANKLLTKGMSANDIVEKHLKALVA